MKNCRVNSFWVCVCVCVHARAHGGWGGILFLFACFSFLTSWIFNTSMSFSPSPLPFIGCVMRQNLTLHEASLISWCAKRIGYWYRNHLKDTSNFCEGYCFIIKCHSEQLELDLSTIKESNSLGCLGFGWQVLLIFMGEQPSPLARKYCTELETDQSKQSEYYGKGNLGLLGLLLQWWNPHCSVITHSLIRMREAKNILCSFSLSYDIPAFNQSRNVFKNKNWQIWPVFLQNLKKSVQPLWFQDCFSLAEGKNRGVCRVFQSWLKKFQIITW